MRDEEPHLGGREEFAGALTGTFREFPQQVLICAAEEIGLDIGEPEPIASIRKGLDDAAQLRRVDVAFAVAESEGFCLTTARTALVKCSPMSFGFVLFPSSSSGHT
jgi:hypothetical protein